MPYLADPLAFDRENMHTHFPVFSLLPFVSISLTVAQNEDVVEQFLKENPSAGRCPLCIKMQLYKNLLILMCC